MADFLLEIGTEEIPARMLESATEELSRRVRELIERERLGSEAQIASFSTPRRLAVLAKGISSAQADVEEQVLGPAVKVAYKDGQPTPAAHAFAKKVNADVLKLETVTNAKGEYLAATVKKQGRPAKDLLAEMLPKEIASIYWAKNMYWRGKSAERFVRPVRWLVSMLDGEVVPVEFAGITAGKKTRGHRILTGNAPTLSPKAGEKDGARPDLKSELTVASASGYDAVLKTGYVIGTATEREKIIRHELDVATRTIPGARWREDKDLLDTVVNLTEFPSVILGGFEHEYLTLPEEVLVTVMRDHQKYFAIEDAQGKLAPYFLAVLNTDSDPDGLIRHGNERVLRARFNDARFFWNSDQKLGLRERADTLKSVTFQKDLGNYCDKTLRVQKLASLVSEMVKDGGLTIRPGIVHKAAHLAKADLTTDLVKEFTELQGIVGGLYAKAQGFDPAIGDAIYDHYKPESMEEEVPRTMEGAVLSLSDKADTIAGMFALGMIPSGSKDPFALRRAANGIVRIIAEHKLPVGLTTLMRDALLEYKGSEAEKKFTATATYTQDVATFFRERLEFYLREAKGFAYDVVNAVLVAGAENVVDVIARAEAVAKVRPSEDFEAISVAFKRIKNILRQAQEAGKWSPVGASGTFYSSGEIDPAERELMLLAPEAGKKARELRAEHRYDEALAEVAKIRKPLDTFFVNTMVMVDDAEVRTRRLNLLQELLSSFSTVADFSEMVTEKK
jgi:glycyl-tRNA synthetase beta chain